MWPRVGVAVADEDVEDTELVNFDVVLVERTELEVLLGAVDPSAEHTAPKPDTSLKVSLNDPLTAPNLDPEADATA